MSYERKKMRRGLSREKNQTSHLWFLRLKKLKNPIHYSMLGHQSRRNRQDSELELGFMVEHLTISCFSVAVIKCHVQGNSEKPGVYFGLQFHRVKVRDGRASVVASSKYSSWNRKLRVHILELYMKQREWSGSRVSPRALKDYPQWCTSSSRAAPSKTEPATEDQFNIIVIQAIATHYS